MNQTLTTHSSRPLPAALLALALAFAGLGCAGTGGNRLTVRSLDRRQTYQQQFSKAYAGRSDRGDFDVVLVKEGDVRQVMHVRVLWKPMKGTKLDHPTATNATLDWIVWDGADGGFIAYTGAGFVNLQRSGNTARLDIRNATLSPTVRDGAINDPIGRVKVSGTVVARTNREKLGDVLAQAEHTTAHARRSPAVAPSAQEASSRAPMDQ